MGHETAIILRKQDQLTAQQGVFTYIVGSPQYVLCYSVSHRAGYQSQEFSEQKLFCNSVLSLEVCSQAFAYNSKHCADSQDETSVKKSSINTIKINKTTV